MHIFKNTNCIKRNRLYTLTVLLLACLWLAGCGEEATTIDATPAATAAPTPTRLPEDRGPLVTPTVPSVQVSSLERIRETGFVRVGVLYNLEPFSYVDETGNLGGFEYALLNAIGEVWDVEVRFIQVTRQTRLEMLLSGEVDILAAATPKNRTLDQFVDYTGTIFLGGYGLLVNDGNVEVSVAELAGQPVGHIAGDEARSVIEAAGMQPVEFESSDVAIAALQTGSIEAFSDRREDLMLIASSASGVDIANELVQEERLALAVREGDTALRDLLDLTLQSLADEGVFSQIFSTTFYRFTADSYRSYLGETTHTFESFPDEVDTASTLDRLRAGEAIRVAGLTLDAEPEPFDGQSIVDGFNRALVNEMARRWNVPVVEIPNSLNEEGLNLLQQNDADLVVGITPDRGLIGRVTYSAPYYQRGILIAHLEDVTVDGINDLDFRDTLALPPTAVTSDLIEDNNGFPAYQETDELEAAYEALLERGPTALVGDELTIILMSQSSEDIEIADEKYRPVDQVIGMRATDNELHALVNYTLQDIVSEGVMTTLADQYFGNYVREDDQLPLPNEGVFIWPGDGSYLNIGQYR